MDPRLKKAERILAVRAQLLRAEQWRLAEIGRERARLEEMRHDLVATLNDALFGPLVIEQASRHLQRVAAADARAEAAQSAQQERVRTEGLATKRAERLADTAAKHARTQAERVESREIAEASALSRDASLA